ncbi:MAG: acyltransferase family protein [Verrucomicrobiota bacterium]
MDGLRAIAVIAVVLFHAGLGFPGGYVGVDVFFVISGFLITQLILRDLQQGRFSMIDFWERRARRILPALVVVVVCVLAAGYFLMLPSDYAAMGQSAMALAVFSSNILFYRENGYFAPVSESKPLLHTWSLSVEEQFYLLIPIFLWGLYRLGWSKRAFWILLFLSLISFSISAVGVYWFSWATFLLLPARAWELAAGCLVAFAKPVHSTRIRQAMSGVGMLGVMLPFFVYSKNTPFPGLAAIPPVLGTALIIWSGMKDSFQQKTFASRILEWDLLVRIGLLSYSLYLWHWPLLAFNQVLEIWKDSIPVKIGLIILSFPLAWISWKFVEQPFRGKGFISSRKMVFASSAFAMAAICMASFLISESKGLPNRKGPIIGSMLEIYSQCMSGVEKMPGGHRRLSESDIPQKLIHLGVQNFTPHVFVWGDSHAEAILPGIDAACRKLGLSGQAAICHGLPPTKIEKIPSKKKSAWSPHNEVVLNYLKSNEARRHIKVVVLIARWSESTQLPDFESRLYEIGSILKDCEYKVVVMDQVPLWSASVTKTLGLQRALGLRCFFENGTVHLVDGFESKRVGRIFQNSNRLDSSMNYLDPNQEFMESDGKVHAYDKNGAFFWDAGHLSYLGAMKLAPLFDAKVLASGP